MPTIHESELQADKVGPPRIPPIAQGLFDEGDDVRRLGEQIAALASRDAATLQSYLERVGATAASSGRRT